MNHKLYPPIPEHEQIRRPFQWPKCHSEDAKIIWNRDRTNCGGRPRKGTTPLCIQLLSVLEKQQWSTCIEMALLLNRKRKTVQEYIKSFYDEGVLIRRRRTPHEYEYSLAELPKQPR